MRLTNLLVSSFLKHHPQKSSDLGLPWRPSGTGLIPRGEAKTPHACCGAYVRIKYLMVH